MSLACGTANEHTLTCSIEIYAVTVRQLYNGTNGDDICKTIATVGNTLQTVNSPQRNMSAPGNAVKLETEHSNVQIAQIASSWLGSNVQCIY